jgi:succinate dehydrogenase / fumarate reductase, membrane anchor subunit
MSRYRTPLSQARGLGAAKHGAAEWLLSGMAVIALVPLCLWVAYGVLRLSALDYYGAVAWIGRPVNATLMILTLTISFWHMHHGLRVVIEDYVHERLGKLSLLLINLVVSGLAGALAVFSVLKVALGSV